MTIADVTGILSVFLLGPFVGFAFSTLRDQNARLGLQPNIATGFLAGIIGSIIGYYVYEYSRLISFEAGLFWGATILSVIVLLMLPSVWLRMWAKLPERDQQTIPEPLESSPEKAPSGSIFLSYRRVDSQDIAGRMYDRLIDAFGKVNVFKDVDAIPLGADFKKFLDEQVSECSVLLAVIGDTWLEARDATGNKRLEDPRDFVRLEIESALKRDIPVIPLLVRGAHMPAEEQLPDTLKQLTFRNGTVIRPDPDFHRDMNRLISQLKNYVKSKR